MKTLIIAVGLMLLQAGAAVAQYGPYPPNRSGPGSYGLRGWGGYGPEARVWVEGNRDYFRRGERLRAGFSTSADAYVAVIHIDPDGRLEFLYPSVPGDREYVLGGRNYSLPYRGASGGLLVRGGGGIGYLYIVASPVPLDYGYFHSRGSAWDWSYAGQTVRGDPFWAMEQITRYLVPDWGYTPVAVDYFSYQVDGIHRYPNYACSSRYGLQSSSWGWGWGGGYTPSYYGACDRVDYYLRDNPYYFDADRYRGDRRSQFRRYGDSEPQYRFKEDPAAGTGSGRTGAARGIAPSTGRAAPSGGTTQPTRRPAATPAATPTRRAAPERNAPAAEPTRRAAPERSAAPAAAPARGVTRPAGDAPAVRRASPSGETSGGGARTAEPRRRSTSDGGS